MLAALVAVSWALAGLLAVVLVVRGSPDRHAPCGGLSPLRRTHAGIKLIYLMHVYVCNERRFGGADFETSHGSRRQKHELFSRHIACPDATLALLATAFFLAASALGRPGFRFSGR